MVLENKDADILIITHGNILDNSIQAVERNPKASIYCMNRIKPVDAGSLDAIFSKYSKIVVIEDHFKSSGLYNTLCQFAVESDHKYINLYSIAPPDRYEERIGDRDYFADRYGYSSEKIGEYLETLS
jgi:transketolase C-terminal domain/subunit